MMRLKMRSWVTFFCVTILRHKKMTFWVNFLTLKKWILYISTWVSWEFFLECWQTCFLIFWMLKFWTFFVKKNTIFLTKFWQKKWLFLTKIWSKKSLFESKIWSKKWLWDKNFDPQMKNFDPQSENFGSEVKILTLRVKILVQNQFFDENHHSRVPTRDRFLRFTEVAWSCYFRENRHFFRVPKRVQNGSKTVDFDPDRQIWGSDPFFWPPRPFSDPPDTFSDPQMSKFWPSEWKSGPRFSFWGSKFRHLRGLKNVFPRVQKRPRWLKISSSISSRYTLFLFICFSTPCVKVLSDSLTWARQTYPKG